MGRDLEGETERKMVWFERAASLHLQWVRKVKASAKEGRTQSAHSSSSAMAYYGHPGGRQVLEYICFVYVYDPSP